MMETCRFYDDPLWYPNSSSTSVHDNTKPEICMDEPEKKRRLRPEQVKFLEKNFDLENKLEPDRKIELAEQLGLHPRQVAIWFQNRRARFKTKVLEEQYNSLKSSYDKLKADYDALCAHNDKLRNEVYLLSQELSSEENVKPEPKFKPRSCNVFDSDSPHCTNGNHSTVLDPSDFSQDEDDNLQPNSCNFGFPVQHQGTWLWQY